MSVLSRVSAPAATHALADMVVTLLSNPQRAAPRELPGSVADQLSGDENQLAASMAGRLLTGPTGLGTSAARIPGLGTPAVRIPAERSADGGSDLELYCPPAVRDDEALGEEVNDRLVDW
ncbi:MAG: hypothetical protein ACRDS1_01110, partial [Pseudonocardiaceae bacterium]